MNREERVANLLLVLAAILVVILVLFFRMQGPDTQAPSPLQPPGKLVLDAQPAQPAPVVAAVHGEISMPQCPEAIFCEPEFEGPCWYNDRMGRKESRTAYKWYDMDVVLWKKAR